MMSRLIALLSAVVLLGACAPKPTDADVAAVLADNIPKDYKSLAEVEQTRLTSRGRETTR